ncbi:MAG: DUF4625 domain-containing protein [Bergeyella zoohelcum]|nr:DUF4625 domain-containing protein [Bergeyella zoohelcum]
MTFKNLVLGLFASLAIISCNRNEEEMAMTTTPPTITNIEIGEENTRKAHPGDELHIEAEVKAEGMIKSLELQITPKKSGSGWVIVERFADAVGKQDYDIHQHYDIPVNAKVGEYDVIITITDLKGQKTTYEAVLTIENNPELPTIPTTDRSFSLSADGKTLGIKALVKAPNKLGEISIRIGTKTFKTLSAEVADKTEYTIDESIDISSLAKGHYHFYVKATDTKSNSVTYEGHFDKK